MSLVHLTSYQRRQLREGLRQTADAQLYQRLLALLELDRGQRVADVAQRLGVTRQTIYNWARAFDEAPRVATLADHYGVGRPSRWTDELHRQLRDALQSRPGEYGYAVPNWTVPALQDLLGRDGGPRLSDDTVRRELHALGYVWKRYRYVLPPDPEREKKTRHPAAAEGVAAAQCQAG